MLLLDVFQIERIYVIHDKDKRSFEEIIKNLEAIGDTCIKISSNEYNSLNISEIKEEAPEIEI